MFTIRKIIKIQVCSNLDAGMTHQIDGLRNPKSKTPEAIDGVKKMIQEIIGVDSREELSLILKKYFPQNKNKIIREFFTKYPTCWFDLIRKLHKFKKYDNENNSWFIEDSGIEEIYSTFLIRGGLDGIGEEIRALLPDAISDNQELLAYSSRQPSILDSGAYRFSNIPNSQRKKNIKSLICFGLIKNIENCTYENIHTHFESVFKRILTYLEEIFGVTVHIGHCKDIDSLSKELEKMFASGNGNEREKAYRVIQSFHAWGDIDHTEEIHDKSVKALSEIPSKLKKLGINIQDISERTLDGVKIFEGRFIYNEHIIKITWRAKTPKSHLHKEWEDEEYVNSDVIRDSIGGSIIWPDNLSEELKGEIISKFSSMMSNFGYILKNKSGVSDNTINAIQEKLKQKRKNPLYITEKRDVVTNELFKNTSISGFMKYKGDESLGTEWQFLDESSAKWKAEDDKRYKPKSAVKAFMRGPKFATPRQCYSLLNKRVKSEDLKKLKLQTINDVIVEMIEDGFVIPYLSVDGTVLLLTYKGKKNQFEQRFPTMKLQTHESTDYPRIKKFIMSIDAESQDSFV